MFDIVEKTYNPHPQVDFEGLYHTIRTTVDTCMDTMSRELVKFQEISINVNSYKCTFSWWHKEEQKFLAITLLVRHIFNIPTSQLK
jgi:hypothetical protein